MAMTKEEQERLDLAEAAADAALATVSQAKQDAAAAIATKDKELSKLRAQTDLLQLQVSRETQDAKAKTSATEREKDVEETIQVRADARRVLGATAKDPTGSKWTHDGRSNETLKRDVVKKLEPEFKDKVDALDAGALDAVYEIALKNHARTDAAQEQILAATIPRDDARRGAADEGEMPSAEDARKKMEEDRRDAWKRTPSRMDRKRMRDSGDGRPNPFAKMGGR